jgi:hypothetical protein
MKETFAMSLAVLILAGGLAAPISLAGEAQAPSADTKAEKKAGKKAGAKKAVTENAGAAGEKKAAAGQEGPLSVKEKNQMKNNMRKFLQNGRLDRLATLVDKVFQRADLGRDRDLLAMAHFYRAGLLAKDLKDAEAWDSIEKSIEFGNLNADGFRSLGIIPDTFKGSEKFKSRMAKLEKETEQLLWSDFEKEVRGSVGSQKAEPFALPPEGGLGPNPLKSEGLKGRPACLIMTPIFHDGFTKEAMALERLAEAYKGKVDVGVLFYQADPNDAGRRDLTANEKTGYISKLGWKKPIPTAVVGREYVKGLEIPYFPAHFFITPKGTVGYRRDGFLEEKQLDFIFGELAKLAPTPPPPSPAPQEPAKEEPKQAPPPKPVEPTT